MRSVRKTNFAGAVWLLAVAILLVGLMGLATGCDDGGEADMYAQISSNSAKPAGGSISADTDTTAPAGQPAGLPSAADPALEPETAGEEAAVPDEDLTLVDSIVIDEIVVKAPYPEFTGEDRYDVKVTLLTEKPLDAQVFRVVAIGADGEPVGELERHLKIPQKKARTLNFEFYCKSIPETVEFHTTDTQAARAGETPEDAGGRSTGSGSGSGSRGGEGTAPSAGLN